MAQTELGNKYALTALRHKRATLAGEIVQLQRQVAWRQKQLEHVDATLAIFGLADADSIKPVKPYKRIALFKQGELSQAVRDALRVAGKPLRTAEVLEAVTEALGHEASALPAMRHRVTASLQYLLRDKAAVTKTGKGRTVRWALA